MVKRFLLDWSRQASRPPFDAPLPSDMVLFEARSGSIGVAWRVMMRSLRLKLAGQSGLQRQRIDGAKRLLWIHQGMPQVGDSLMDLAARVLLQGHVERLDLLTDAHLLPLYQHDRVFSQVASAPGDLPDGYDLILLHSTSSYSVRDKLRYYRQVPFVHVHGQYTGPEFNRTLFGFYRLAQLMGREDWFPVIPQQARSIMWCGPGAAAVADGLHVPPGAVAIALGGVHGWRTYHRWVEVVAQLRERTGSCPPLVLVGAANGRQERDRLVAAHPGFPFIDRLERHSLPEVYALFQRCSQVLAADGGLLHVAQSAAVPVVGLFAGIIHPSYRVTPANPTCALYGANAVDDVSPAQIVEAMMQMRSTYVFSPPLRAEVGSG